MPAHKNRVTTACQTCGRSFEIAASRLRWGRGRSCSPACQHEAVSQKQSQKVALTCLGCGRVFWRSPSHVGDPTGKGKFCTRACRDANRVGVLHPQYIDGVSNYRGPNWQAQKRKARERDQRICRTCGRPGQDVHHVRPFRLFDGDYRAANALENLVTLCAACHRSAEAALQATERVGTAHGHTATA